MADWMIYASGRVQGVGFRATCQSYANTMGVFGYAKNLADGRVEIRAVGQVEDLSRLCELLQSGPPDGFDASLDINMHVDEKVSYQDFAIY